MKTDHYDDLSDDAKIARSSAHLTTQSTRAHNFQEQKKTEKRRAENDAEKAGTASEAERKRVCLLCWFVGVSSHALCQNEVIRKCALHYNSLIRFMQVLKAMEPDTFDLVRVRACLYT